MNNYFVLKLLDMLIGVILSFFSENATLDLTSDIQYFTSTGEIHYLNLLFVCLQTQDLSIKKLFRHFSSQASCYDRYLPRRNENWSQICQKVELHVSYKRAKWILPS